MKSLVSKAVGALVGVWAFMGVANAEQVIVYQAPVDGPIQVNSVNFAVNRDLGRAWVDIGVQASWSGSEPGFDPPIERQIEGLYYDSARKQVLCRTANGPIVCADDAGSHLNDTGNCKLIASTEQRKVDDGFVVRDEKYATVVFDAPTSSPTKEAAATPPMIR